MGEVGKIFLQGSQLADLFWGRPEISDKLKCFIGTEFPNQGIGFEEFTNLLEEWFVDLGIVETAFFTESTFHIKVSRADINGTNFESIATLTEFVVARMNSQPLADAPCPHY